MAGYRPGESRNRGRPPGTTARRVLLWDFKAAAVSHRINVNQLGLFDICFLDEGKHLSSGGCNGQVGLWDLTA